MPRPTVPQSTQEPVAPRVRDFTAPRMPGVRVEFDVRTVYDFVFSLSEEAGETEDLLAADRQWLAEGRALLPSSTEGLRHDVCDLAIRLGGLAVDRPEIRTASDFVRLIGSVPNDVVVRAVVAEDLRDPATAGLTSRALDHDAAAIDALVARHLEDHAGDEQDQVGSLLRDPAPIVGQLRELLAAWLRHFETLEPRVLGMLERDVALRATDRRTLAPTDLIERTTGGIRWRSEQGVSRVILAPSYFTRPYNYVLGGVDWRLYGYPIADVALGTGDPMAPPQDVVRLHRALGDDTRLRILRLLRDRDLYLTELAGLLSLSKPTVKHHLALLRAAGLVTVTDEGGMTYYSLRGDRLDAASSELKRFLLG